ncbi:hypothetical protein BaRGS_00002165 [Batillaria attramentaria]|uniref:C1q domain-containing protein n=1 Tax=Batillaria attramentaria TaxID=370345 RepID=A0ABD0M459_9CAEN
MLFSVLGLLLLAVAASVGVPISESRRQHERSDDPGSWEAVVQQQAQKISQQEAELTELKAGLASLRARIATQETRVAFNVRLSTTTSQPFTGTQTLVFGLVDLNQGGAYDKDTGFFTAPISGLYLFSLHLTHTPPGSIHAKIMKNGVEIAEVEASGDDKYHDRSSSSVVVHLAKADKVWVKRYDGGSTQVQGGWRTAFTGILVVPDQQ